MPKQTRYPYIRDLKMRALFDAIADEAKRRRISVEKMRAIFTRQHEKLAKQRSKKAKGHGRSRPR